MKTYSEKMAQLKAEFSQLNKNRRGKYEFSQHQQAVYDYVIGKRSIVQFEVDGKQFFLKKGNSEFGFKHIIMKHYSDDCVGCISARDILNIANVVRFGRELSDIELNRGVNLGYEQVKDEKIFRVIFNKDRNGNFVVTFFSRD